MKPHHHLDPATLIGYSAGALPDSFAVVVRAHLDNCAQCRGELLDADRLGGQLLRQQEGAPLSSNARDNILARLQAEPAAPIAPLRAAAPHADADLLPAALQPHFGARYSELDWRWLGPGVQHIRAQGVSDGNLMLLRVAPGHCIPLHSHCGNELTQILRGAYDDALGHFAPGDIADLDGEVEHQPVTAAGVHCICVAATDAPLRFSGWLARTLQPLFRL